MSDTVRKAVQPGRKSFVLFAIGLVAIVSGVNACNDSPGKTVEPGNARVAMREISPDANPNAAVGERHNAMIDAVLRDVSKKRRAKGPQKKLCKQVEESAIQYAQSNAKEPAEAIRLLEQHDFCGSRGGKAGIKPGGISVNIAEGYGLTARATQLLNMTDYYVGASFSAGELASYLQPIDVAALADLDWEEAQIVTSATSVAVNSFAYWSANLVTWQTELGTSAATIRAEQGFGDARLTPKYSFWGDVWTIGKADLEGAISGGVAARLAKAVIPEAAFWNAAAKSLIKGINML